MSFFQVTKTDGTKILVNEEEFAILDAANELVDRPLTSTIEPLNIEEVFGDEEDYDDYLKTR